MVLGPVPMVGEDERFPSGFTISAEKCPNRRGVEAIIAHFSACASFDDLLPEVEHGSAMRSGWPADIRPTGSMKPRPSELAGHRLLVVQDLFPSAVTEVRTTCCRLRPMPNAKALRELHRPAAIVPWAIRPPRASGPKAVCFGSCCGRKGLYNARAVLQEIARKDPLFFRGGRRLPEMGVDLKVNLLVELRRENENGVGETCTCQIDRLTGFQKLSWTTGKMIPDPYFRTSRQWKNMLD